jgi:tRNA (mo5U34)-methyltransferase
VPRVVEPSTADDTARLAAGVARESPWYHTFDLPGGVVTDGYYDLRSIPAKVSLPASLAGKRCLDVAACEGFWSFELAKRGAAEVVSVDLPDATEQDWQGEVDQETRERGTGLANRHFRFIRDALGEDSVTRVDMNVYDVTPDELGTFDFVFIGNILIHLADPARALRTLRATMASGAELISLEPASLILSALSPRIPLGQLWDIDDQPRWWTPNIAGHRRIVHAAGFRIVDSGGPIFQPFGKGMASRPPRRPRTARELLYWLIVRRFGVASSWVRAVAAGSASETDRSAQPDQSAA